MIRDAAKSIQKLDIYDYEGDRHTDFGAELDSMMRAAEIVEEAKPEVLDINFGCPVKGGLQNGGAGILQDIGKMVELTEAVVKSTSLPVT